MSGFHMELKKKQHPGGRGRCVGAAKSPTVLSNTLPGLGDQAGLSGSCREASSLPWEVGPEVLGGSWTRKLGYSNREGFLQLGWGGAL